MTTPLGNFIQLRFLLRKGHIKISSIFFQSWVCFLCCGILIHSRETNQHSYICQASTTMAWVCFRRVCLIPGLFAFSAACNEDESCNGCQSPLIQNPSVPWAASLDNTRLYFSGHHFRVMKFLPQNSFVLSPFIKVCWCLSSCLAAVFCFKYAQKLFVLSISLSIIMTSCVVGTVLFGIYRSMIYSAENDDVVSIFNKSCCVPVRLFK